MGFNEEVNKKTVVGALAWKTMERVLAQGTNLLIQIILARLLLPEDFGSLALVTAVISFATIFVQEGLATAIIQKEDLTEIDISTVLTASLSVAAVLYVGLFLGAPGIAELYGHQELKWVLRVLALTLFGGAIYSIQTAVLSRKLHFRQIFLRSAVAIPVSGAIGVTMAYWGFGVWALVAQQLVNIIVTVVIMSLNKEVRFPLRFSWESAKRLYSFSGKMLVSGLIQGAYDSLRTLWIGKNFSAAELAYYDKANTYSAYAVQIIQSSVSSVLLPVFSRRQKDAEELKNTVRRSIKLYGFVVFPVLMGVATLAAPLVELLLTEKWIESAPYLAIFCILRMIRGIITIDYQAYFALGKSGLYLALIIGQFMLNITVLFCTMQYSVMAVAVGAVAVEAIYSVLVFSVSATVYKYRLLERVNDLARPISNSVITAIVVTGLEHVSLPLFPRLAMQIVVGAILYISLSLLTKDETIKYCLSLIETFLKKNE